MLINMPDNVKRIIHTLQSAGYEGYAVGGCVRDAILGREPQDWDITTSARPEQVKALFNKTIDTGIQHGTVTVMLGGTGYEVTTYRIDGEYKDGRHPESVEFSDLLTEDLKRRDFTINAMAYNDEVGLVDEFDGQNDLENGIIRCVGNPLERFTEDALRMMRAIRFAAQLGFEIEKGTYGAIVLLSKTIEKISRERICTELDKLLISDRPQYVKLFSDTGIALVVLPLLDKVLKANNVNSLLKGLELSKNNLCLRYAAMLHSEKPEEVRAFLKSLKLDNKTIDTVTMLVENAKFDCDENDYQVRKALNKFGMDNLELILQNSLSKIEAKEAVIGLKMNRQRHHVKMIKHFAEEIIERGDCYTLSGLAVTGKDIMDKGYQGKEVGNVLNRLLDMVMENQEINTKERLLRAVDEYC